MLVYYIICYIVYYVICYSITLHFEGNNVLTQKAGLRETMAPGRPQKGKFKTKKTDNKNNS